MYATILIVHIIGALLTGAIALVACVAMLARIESVYRTIAIVLSALAALEVLSGTMLAVFSPSITMLSVCGNIALYLMSVGLVQSLLFARLRQLSQEFPVAETLAPVSASLAVILAALVLGF